MKTSLTISLALMLSFNVIGSTNPIQQPKSVTFSVNSFGNFNVHRQHNNAALSWIYNSPDVTTFVIQRSYDGSNFHIVGQQGPGGGHWNRFLDTTVEPGTIYYKVTAIASDGSHEDSPVEEVRIVRHR